jgi:hypothetical protein
MNIYRVEMGDPYRDRNGLSKTILLKMNILPFELESCFDKIQELTGLYPKGLCENFEDKYISKKEVTDLLKICSTPEQKQSLLDLIEPNWEYKISYKITPDNFDSLPDEIQFKNWKETEVHEEFRFNFDTRHPQGFLKFLLILCQVIKPEFHFEFITLPEIDGLSGIGYGLFSK